ncbi:hypothetical protein HYPSUDRAFT_66378 [Hypholoma sublateritium FD-334 SS-4]|uniref:Uncharacterized protein n=1 Tax=Hypholoma sublateritium (strain FD-334 SS-4) TaxID=945553 RepID=A0A0D2L8C8_HYPSF|nr:hypothetical protein HYPSUDRAFT_66378 [Hypholoma sublateritium FD-334 SS-4]
MLSTSIPRILKRKSFQAVHISAHIRICPLSETRIRARSLSSFSPTHHTRRNGLFLFTLRPDRIIQTGQEIVDLSGLTSKFITVPFEHPRWPNPRNPGKNVKLVGRQVGSTTVQFPANTRGFFYYRHGITDLAGSVRFRLCDGAAAFESGRDLVRTDRPWQPQLVDIVGSANLRPFIPLLLAEQLVDEKVLVDAAQIRVQCMSAKSRFYSFSEPFTLPLNLYTFGSLFITRKSWHTHGFRDLYHDRRNGTTIQFPYSGRILARFEISAFPEHAKLGPCLLLKCLDIIDPVECVMPNYDGFVEQPTPGSYHTRGGKLWHIPLMRHLDTFRNMMEQEGLLPRL